MSDLENARKRREKEMKEKQEKERARAKEARNTQFEGFAKALWEEIMEMTLKGYGKIDAGTAPKGYELLIARRAYDLACHAIDNSRANDMEDWETERIMPYVPDMTELPKGEGRV